MGFIVVLVYNSIIYACVYVYVCVYVIDNSVKYTNFWDMQIFLKKNAKKVYFVKSSLQKWEKKEKNAKKLAYIKKKYYLCTEFRKQPIINLLKERKSYGTQA